MKALAMAGMSVLLTACTQTTYNVAPLTDAGLLYQEDGLVSETELARVQVVPLVDNLPSQPGILLQVVNLDQVAHTLSPDSVTIRLDGQVYEHRSFNDLRREIEAATHAQRLSLMAEAEDASEVRYENLGLGNQSPETRMYSDEVGIAYRQTDLTHRTWVSHQHQIDRIERSEAIELARLQSRLLPTVELEPQSSSSGQIIFDSIAPSHDPMVMTVDVEFAGEHHSFSFEILPVETDRFEPLISRVWPIGD